MDNEHVWLTTRELSETLKVTQSAIRQWGREGLPTEHFGRLTRYNLDAVLTYLRERHAAKVRAPRPVKKTAKTKKAA